MRWIGVHLPWLSLESFAATREGELEAHPLALMDAHQVVRANAQAQSRGVQPGLKRATALALVADLVMGQADARRDAQALQAVAHAALAFTPMVCPCPPDGLLLEVQSTLRYFGGREALLKRLHEALLPLGHRVQLADAPTPLGAHWLARLRHGLHADDVPALQRLLDAAPLWLLSGEPEHGATWVAMGLTRLGALRQLPRSGLARRFGERLLVEIDNAYGRRADPREPLVPAPVFHSRLELFARADTTEQLLHGAQALLGRLVAWLSGRHAFVRRFELQMNHESRWRRDDTPARTLLEVALAEPSRDAAHLMVLLRERLAALQLPAPTLELELHAHDIAQQPPPNDELFPTPASDRDGLVRLVERLQARLGPARIQQLLAVPDHRPEQATQCVTVDASRLRLVKPAPCVSPTVSADGALHRPAWLLAEPVPLCDGPTGPLLDGHALRLLAGPERIESGWWDAGLIERDYFVAQAPDDALVWLFRERVPRRDGRGMGWFLQGLFA